MVGLYVIPEWFFIYNIILELVFGAISLAVGLYALKIYKWTLERQPKLFGISFLFISISFFVQAILNIILCSKLHLERIIQLTTFNMLTSLGTYLHIIFFLIGLVTLVYLTLDIKSFRAYSLLFILVMGSLIVTSYKLNIFHIFSSILLLYIIGHYLVSYLTHRQIKNLIVLVAFVLLFISHINLIFSLSSGIYFVIGDIIGFVGYVLILINLILVTKK